MKKEFCMSYFNAPVAPIKDADGRLLLRATTTPASTLTVEQVYHMITANNCLQQLTREVRSALDRRLAKQSFLPYVTPCGVFSYRSTANLTKLSGLLPIDIDHLDTPDEAVEMRQLLFDDPALRPVLCYQPRRTRREGIRALPSALWGRSRTMCLREHLLGYGVCEDALQSCRKRFRQRGGPLGQGPGAHLLPMPRCRCAVAYRRDYRLNFNSKNCLP